MQQVIRMAAGEHERFAPHSWDSQIGKTVPFKINERRVEDATLLSAEVAGDGSEVRLTVEVPDRSEQAAIARAGIGPFSVFPGPEGEISVIVPPATRQL